MEKNIKLNESDIQEKEKQDRINRNIEIMNGQCKRIQEVLDSVLATLQHNLSLPNESDPMLLNPMLIKEMPDGAEKKHVEHVLQFFQKLVDFYNYVHI